MGGGLKIYKKKVSEKKQDLRFSVKRKYPNTRAQILMLDSSNPTLSKEHRRMLVTSHNNRIQLNTMQHSTEMGSQES